MNRVPVESAVDIGPDALRKLDVPLLKKGRYQSLQMHYDFMRPCGLAWRLEYVAAKIGRH